MKIQLTTLALCMTLGAAPFVSADEMAHSQGLMISDAWSRVTTPAARVGGGYLTITNHGEMTDTLLGVSAEHAGKTEVHSMKMADDVMIMRPVDEPLVIDAGASVQLAPGGLHLMFMQLEAPHVAGEPFNATLRFEHAGDVEVRFEVLSMRESMERQAETGHDMHGSDDKAAEWGTQ